MNCKDIKTLYMFMFTNMCYVKWCYIDTFMCTVIWLCSVEHECYEVFVVPVCNKDYNNNAEIKIYRSAYQNGHHDNYPLEGIKSKLQILLLKSTKGCLLTSIVYNTASFGIIPNPKSTKALHVFVLLCYFGVIYNI